MEGGKTRWQTEAGFGVALIPYMDLDSTQCPIEWQTIRTGSCLLLLSSQYQYLKVQPYLNPWPNQSLE